MKRRTFLAIAGATPWSSFVRAEDAASDARLVITWPEILLLDGGVLGPESWHGQPAVVVFWATYCPFCKRHNAHVDKLHRASRRRSLRVLGVAIDGDEGSVRRYMATNGYAFPPSSTHPPLADLIARLRQMLPAN